MASPQSVLPCPWLAFRDTPHRLPATRTNGPNVPTGHPDVSTRNEPRELLLTLRSRRATDGRPDPVRCCHRAAFGQRSRPGLGSAANHVHWRVRCRCSRSDPGRSPRPRVSPPKWRAARPAGDPLVPAGPPTEVDGRGRGLGDTNDAHPCSHLRQGVRRAASSRLSSVLAARSPRPKPAALQGVSLGRAPGDAEAFPKATPMTHCTILPGAVGGRVDLCQA